MEKDDNCPVTALNSPCPLVAVKVERAEFSISFCPACKYSQSLLFYHFRF